MKAVLLTSHGGPEMLRYGDAPDPVAKPDEVLVDVHAASVNAADYKVRLGSSDSKMKFPYILGRDFSGVIAKRGAKVKDLAVGDAVFGVCDAGIEGCYAEKVAIKAAIIAKKPDLLTHAQAAAMALTSLTAIWALEDTAQLFLGLRIQCARCHHHPFERWSQDDYYGMAAFFSRVTSKPEVSSRR